MPALDRQNALTARYFHQSMFCAQTVTYGPRGGPQYPRTELWRRNGATQTWKTRPDEFRVPVKYGMRDYHALTETMFGWHVGTAEDCPDGTLRDSLATALAARLAAE